MLLFDTDVSYILCRYRGEQLNRGGTSAKRKCPISREILISTVYDQPGSEGGGDTVLRSGIEGIKYRTNFRAGGLLNPQTKTHS